jgi:hypothetical protein
MGQAQMANEAAIGSFLESRGWNRVGRKTWSHAAFETQWPTMDALALEVEHRDKCEAKANPAAPSARASGPQRPRTERLARAGGTMTVREFVDGIRATYTPVQFRQLRLNSFAYLLDVDPDQVAKMFLGIPRIGS